MEQGIRELLLYCIKLFLSGVFPLLHFISRARETKASCRCFLLQLCYLLYTVEFAVVWPHYFTVLTKSRSQLENKSRTLFD